MKSPLFLLVSDPEHGPWMAQMTPRHVYPFLRYCGTQAHRRGIWDRWVAKAGFEQLGRNNSSTIEDLRGMV